MRIRLLFLTVLIAAVAATPAHAASGSVDPTFGTGGEAHAAVDGGTTIMRGGLFQQTDGRIVVAGTFVPDNPDPSQPNPTQGSAVLARFTRSGKRDMGYGTDGWASDNRFETLGRPVAGPADTLLLPGGQWGSSQTASAWVARYTADGDRDDRFGDDGALKLDLPAEGAWGVRSLAVDRDGSVYAAVVGYPHKDADGNWVPNTMGYTVVHLRGDGTVDRSFGADGLARTENTLDDQPWLIAIAPDGGLIVATTQYDQAFTPTGGGAVPHVYLKRITRDGTVDTAFGNDGTIDTGIDAFPSDLLVDRKGVVTLVTPTADTGSASKAVVARYDKLGTPLGDYANDGVFKILVGDSTVPAAAALQTDGKLVVAGGFFVGAANVFFSSPAGWTILRVNPTGKLDKSFGDSGVVTSARGPNFTQASDVAVQDDGDIIVGGTATDCHGEGSLTLVRFVGDDDGRPDPGPLVSNCDSTIPVDGGEIPVVIDCPLIEDSCDGTVTVEVPDPDVPAAKGRFHLRGSQAKKTIVRLSSRARAYASTHPRFKAVLTIKARDADGHKRVVRRRVNVTG